jgi:hypothetical protein
VAYIGQNADGNFTTSVSKDTFSGNGSTTAFTLSEGATTNTVDVFVENIRQEPTTAYTVDGTTLTFTAAPVTGTDNIYVVNRGPIQLSASHPAAQALTAFSATITNDLTVDTNTLFVDASADAVYINKSSSDTGTVGFEARANGQTVATIDGGTALIANRLTSTGDIQKWMKDGTAVGIAGVDAGGFYLDGEASHTGLRFKGGAVTPRLNGAQADNTVGLGNATERFSDLYLGGSLFVGGTGSANALDDYEEGTFTPTYLGSSSNPTVTYTSQTAGSYVKIGRQVIAKIVLRTDSVSGGSGNLYIGGLPFAASAASGTRAGTLNVGYSSNFITKSPQSGYINDSDTVIVLTTNLTDDARSGLDGTVLTTHLQTGTNDNFIMATLIYET